MLAAAARLVDPGIASHAGRPSAGLYDAPSRVRRLRGEIANKSDISQFKFRGEDPHPSEIVQRRSQAGERIGEIYGRMLLDDSALAGLFAKRARAVFGLDRWVRPAKFNKEGLEVARSCREMLRAVPSLHTSFLHAQKSVSHGISLLEIDWHAPKAGPLRGLWTPRDLIDRPMHRFSFRDRRLFVGSGGLASKATPAPPGKFICHSRGSKDSPWGLALLDQLWRFWQIKKTILQLQLSTIDRFGQPAVKVSLPANLGPDYPIADATRDALDMIKRYQHEFGAVLPPGWEADLMEASMSGSVLYQPLIDGINRSMALLVLGEVDTSGMGAGPGSFAKSDVSDRVRVETQRIDAHEISTLFSDTLLRWFVTLNYGPSVPSPKLIFDADGAMEIKLRREGLEWLHMKGIDLCLEDVLRVFGARKPEDDEEVFEGFREAA